MKKTLLALYICSIIANTSAQAPAGFNYCKEHYAEFGSDQWWPEETINKDNLRKVLEKT